MFTYIDYRAVQRISVSGYILTYQHVHIWMQRGQTNELCLSHAGIRVVLGNSRKIYYWSQIAVKYFLGIIALHFETLTRERIIQYVPAFIIYS